MADSEKNKTEKGNAADVNISLSQALLAPLDAIFKAQLHSARSFLNMLLQLGYPHRPVDAKGEATDGDDKPYNMEFFHETQSNGEVQLNKISVPALALVPISPLAVESAEFDFSMTVKKIGTHTQMQESTSDRESYDRHKRPWFLVEDPVSVRGVLHPTGEKEGKADTSQFSSINIKVKVGSIPLPSGVSKLLTSLSQSSQMVEVERRPIKPEG